MIAEIEEIKRLCEEGIQAHGAEFYAPILEQLTILEQLAMLDIPFDADLLRTKIRQHVVAAICLKLHHDQDAAVADLFAGDVADAVVNILVPEE